MKEASMKLFNSLFARLAQVFRSTDAAKIRTRDPIYQLEQAGPDPKQACRFISQNDRLSRRPRLPAILIGLHIQRIRRLLVGYDFAAADAYYDLVCHCYHPEAYARIRRVYVKHCRERLLEQLHSLLEQFHFQEADTLARQNRMVVPAAEYQRMKAKSIQRFFWQRYRHEVNEEQALALANTARNVLVKARAGTGKTRTVVSRAVLAIDSEQLHPNQVLMLAFNREAARQLRQRMQAGFQLPQFATAMTFHSLAYTIVRPQNTIISDDGERFPVIAKALANVRTDTFRILANHFFHVAEDAELLPDQTLDDASYLAYRRNDMQLLTLSGTQVKSRGEKWVADFLFEHDICFNYEQVYWWNGRPYRPDFRIYDPGSNYATLAIIEHWGVSENDADGDFLFGGPMTAGEYRQQQDGKRAY